MERVSGIGGFFFPAADPEGLARWYSEHLGITPPPSTYDAPPWWQDAGPTVFTGLPEESEHFPPNRTWAVNFRVRSLEAMVAQLEAAGITVERDPEEYPNGWFANLKDPEGNGIQLWQPAGTDAAPRGAGGT